MIHREGEKELFILGRIGSLEFEVAHSFGLSFRQNKITHTRTIEQKRISLYSN